MREVSSTQVITAIAITTMRPYAPYERIAVIAMAVITCVDDTSRLALASERTRFATRGTGA